jgi:hypothetical protein
MEYEIVKGLGGDFIRATKDDGDVLLIPMDENNADYQKYLSDIAE